MAERAGFADVPPAAVRRRSRPSPNPSNPAREPSSWLAPLRQQRRSPLARASLVVGGEGGIRTRGTLLAYTRFPGVHLRPLGHLSVPASSRRARFYLRAPSP